MPPPFVIPSQPNRRVVTRLIPGPVGPTGPAGATFVHTQSSAADVWTVAHNLGFRPTVTVIDAGFREVEASVEHLSVNVAQISFVTPTAGYARFS